nr:reverse transcriptase domain-containing protein [Tanacetum cinerariifolium]
MAYRTMEELLQAPMEGYGEAIIIPKILAKIFEIKTNLLQLVQTNKFHGFERDNPHTHISNFKRMTSTLKYRDTTHLKNEISRFTQRFEETFGEAWERFKEMLRACPHHGFSELTQIDTFYNGLNEKDQDSLNAVAGGNLLSKTTREALKIIENKSKVRYSRSKSNVYRVNTNSRESSSKTDDRIDKLADQISNLVEIVNKQVITPTSVKAVKKSCVIFGGAHDYYDCIATDSNQSSLCAATGSFFHNQTLTLGTLPSNTIPNPKGEMKAVTTRSGLACEGPSIPTNSSLEKPSDAHLLMPKFASTIKRFLTNKDKLFELAKVPLNENCSAMLLKKLPETLGDPDNFLIPCDFSGMDISPNSREIFLGTGCALIDVYGEETTLRVNDESEFAQDVLDFKYNSKSGNPTLVANPSLPKETKSEFCKEPIVKSSSPTLTPFAQSDFLFEKIENFLKDESIPTGIKDSYYDPEGDILYLEKLINDDPSQLPPMDLKQAEETNAKSSIEEPSELGLKELLSYLEYAFLEETDELHVIIAKDLKDDEKEALLKVLKSHKRGIAWKISDIKGIDPRFCTHKILMEEDYKPAVQSHRRENCHFMCKEGLVLGHKISKSGIEVDRAKVDVIAKLSHLTTVKGVRNFLGHADFYRRFIQDFSKIARPMTHLLEKETPFLFYKYCIDALETLKKKLTEAPILVVPDWNLPFELMCDANDFRLVWFWDNER